MDETRIIRAWRDPEYYESLSEAERAALPANPAGLIEVDAEILDAATGAGVCDPGPPFPDGYTCSSYTVICTPCPPLQCY